MTNVSPEALEKKRKFDALKKEYLQTLGYKVEYIWECEWNTQLRQHPEILQQIKDAQFLKYEGPAWDPSVEMTEKQILELVRQEQLYGFLRVDISIQDENLKKHCAEFSPFFKHATISRNDVGDHMREFAEEAGLLKTPQRALIGSMFADDFWVGTPLLKWYLDFGFTVTKIHEVVQYEGVSVFEDFVDSTTATRRAADKDPDLEIHGACAKLLGNSSPGRSLMNIHKHTQVQIVDRQTAMRAVNSPYFLHLDHINDDTCELQMRKKFIPCKMPRQIGLMVYSYAKMYLLSFYYDLIAKYIPKHLHQCILTDTDSCYISLAAPSLRAAVKPELLPEYDQEIKNWMPQYLCDFHYQERQEARQRGESNDSEFNVLQACCHEVKDYQKRTLGLWKVECVSDGVVALAPKSYACFNLPEEDVCDTNKIVKLSHKGVQKSNNDLTAEDYWRVLDSTKPRYIVNRGMRLHGENTMRTYRLEKRGLSYLYTKRKVLADGISTIPLDL